MRRHAPKDHHAYILHITLNYQIFNFDSVFYENERQLEHISQ